MPPVPSNRIMMKVKKAQTQAAEQKEKETPNTSTTATTKLGNVKVKIPQNVQFVHHQGQIKGR